MISKAQIEYIIALNKLKSFQKASEACFVTQPTLSMQLKKAEDTLDYKLFDRSKSPIELTPIGEKILPELHQILESYENLTTSIDKLKGSFKAEVRIGIIPTIAVYLVPQLYKDWQKKLTGIKLIISELKSSQILEQLEDRSIDIGIMAGPITKQSLKSQILFNEEICIYAPKLNRKTITVEELQELKPWLLSQGNCLRTQMINFCNLSESPSDEWSYEGGNLNLLTQMVEQEGGYTLIPNEYRKLLNLKDSYFTKIKDHTPARQIVAVYLDRSKKIEHFSPIIREIQLAKGKESISPKFADLLPWK